MTSASDQLFIGLCVQDNRVNVKFMQSLVQTLMQMEPTPIVQYSAGDGLPRSRNAIAAQFLASNARKLLFLDSDLIFTPEDVARISRHDLPLVGGTYPRKTEKLSFCFNDLIPPSETKANGLREVRYIGTGFLCIDRLVFERMIDAGADQYRDEERQRIYWDFFRQGVFKTDDPYPRYLTEDFYLCHRWRELGGKVFLDTNVQLQHQGMATWPLPHHYERPERH